MCCQVKSAKACLTRCCGVSYFLADTVLRADESFVGVTCLFLLEFFI
jgi:hypothetical protein